MNFRKCTNFVKNNSGKIALTAILLLIVFLNLKPGYLILGNDTFAPELNPSLSLERSTFAPGWRTYRALGIPSDSEQSDVFRTFIFFLLQKFLSAWVVSQGYLFFTFFIGSFSMASLVAYMTKRFFGKNFCNRAFLFGGLFYLCTTLTSWVYFFPVQLFVAAYAFLPLTLWRFACFFEKQTVRNVLLLLVSSLLLSSAALTATMFVVCALVVSLFSLIFFQEKKGERKVSILLIGLFITLGTQMYWFLPFTTYVQTNAKAFSDSSITREITATTFENETKHNTAMNAIRYYASWMDTRENGGMYTFTHRDWYKKSPVATIISFIPVVLAFFGAWYLFRQGSNPYLFLPFLAIAGWYFIKGVNPPFGFIFELFQERFPLVAHAFRWQSSKLWPFLVASMPILSTTGTIVIFTKLREHTSNLSKAIPTLFLGFLALGLLGFVYPYFKGELIRKEAFVRVPNEYFDLARYLRETDRFSRIYLVPEANTLYFRNYEWGFWGSAVLHYVLSNPIIEKALIIGSAQSEQAFTVLQNAYYSERPESFTAALKLFDTPLVLSDRHAVAGQTGYAYNWDVHRRIIEENPELEKVWGEGKLELYRLKNHKRDFSLHAFPVALQNDFLRLNTILAATLQSGSYYTEKNTPGTIYPFALQFERIQFMPEEIIGETTYKGPSASYQLRLSPRQVISSPTGILYDPVGRSLSLFPLFPSVEVNGKHYSYSLPFNKYRVENPASFISLDGQVIDVRTTSNPKGVSSAYGNVQLSSMRSWVGTFEPFDLLAHSYDKPYFFCGRTPLVKITSVYEGEKTKCGSPEIPFEQDSIVEAEIRLTSNVPVRAILCLESSYKKTCLNKNVTMFVNKAVEAITLLSSVSERGETLKIFLDLDTQERKADVVVEKLILRIYQMQEIPTFLGEKEIHQEQSMSVPLTSSDSIALHVPLFEGPGGYVFHSEGALVPEVSVNPFGDGTSFKNSVSISSEMGVEIVSQETHTSIFPKLSLLGGENALALVAVSGEHASGIPLELSLRDINKPYRVWARRLFYKRQTHALDLFSLPSVPSSYYLEALSTGIGPRASKNNLQALVLQVIPHDWATLALTPENQEQAVRQATVLPKARSRETNSYKGQIEGTEKIILTIPTSHSPYWKLHMDGEREGEKVVVNGWQQGWKVGKRGIATVEYFPNVFVYLGFLPIFAVTVWLAQAFARSLFAGLWYTASRLVAHIGRLQRASPPQRLEGD